MNKYILVRIDKNCKVWEGYRRLERELSEGTLNGVNGDKVFWKMENFNYYW